MLAAVPSASPHTQRSISAPDDDRLCAGCSRSVSSETGGVVVAFGNSLWHVDCFKCAKCGNQVNADTNLLLLSDGSPVCANCYNCKVCKLPILDEAVMTGDDSYHAACFTCRSCKNRIDELVFAKTSQGFYCMKCHNERVARSRRHIAKQKQRDRDRQAVGSASGRSAASGSMNSRYREGEHSNRMSPTPDHSLSSSVSRPGYASGTSSSGSHSHGRDVLGSSQAGARTSSSSNRADSNAGHDPNISVADASFLSTNSAADATVAPLHHPEPERRSLSPAPQAVFAVAGASGSGNRTSKEEQEYLRTRPGPSSQNPAVNGESSRSRPSLDGPPPPPYSPTPPPNHARSDVGSLRSSVDATGSGPASPSVSVSVPQEEFPGDCSSVGIESSVSTSLPYLSTGNRDSLTPRERPAEGSSSSGWPAEIEQNSRRKSYDDGTRPLSAFLYPRPGSSGGTAGLTVTKNKRDKRGSINPGLQLEAQSFLKLQSETTVVPSSSVPSSPTAAGSASTPSGSHYLAQSPTGGRDSPRVTSPLRDYFVGADEDSSGSTTFYSPAASPQPIRGDSPSSSKDVIVASVSSAVSSAGTPSPPATKDFLAKLPQRSDSLRGMDSTTALASMAPTVSRIPETSALSSLPSPSLNGRLHAPSPPLRTQRSFDERGGRLSPRKAEFGVEGGKRSRSVSPKPPDVPRSIESGTDTETDLGNDSDDITQSYMDFSREGPSRKRQSDQPPAPPPKDSNDSIVETHSRSTSLAQSVSEPLTATSADGEGFERESPDDSISPMSSVTERTSGFFIAPALPPMRFSMSGTDFRDILNTLGNGPPSSKRLSTRLERRNSRPDGNNVAIPEEKEEDVALAKTPTSIASTVTPPERKPESPPTEMTSSSLQTSLSSRRTTTPDQLVMPSDGEKTNPYRPASTSPTSPNRPDIPRKSPQRSSLTKSSSMVRIPEESNSSNPSEPRQAGSPKPDVNGVNSRERLDSVVSVQLNGVASSLDTPSPRMINGVSRPSLSRNDSMDLVPRRLKEALADANERGSDYVKLDRSFIEAIISSLDHRGAQMNEMTSKLDGMKRTSQLMFDGLSVAQEEYDQELNARRNAEAEVSRLKIELSGQAARLTALSSDDRRREVQKQIHQELSENLNGLEREMSKLKVERDMTLAEVEELSASKSSAPNGDVPVATVGRSLTMRLDNIKRQYQHELVPLTQQREALMREILELKEARDIFLEETAVLNARNEELAQLNTQYERRLETASDSGHSKQKSSSTPAHSKNSFDSWKGRQAQAPAMVNTTSTSSSATLIDEQEVRPQPKPIKADVGDTPAAQRTRGIGLRWPGVKMNKEQTTFQPAVNDSSKGKKRLEHAFQQLSILRFARCDHCGDKMWGSQVRCSACSLAVHVRCVGQVQTSCVHENSSDGHDELLSQVGPPPPSMFGRDLIEQIRADSKDTERYIPTLVEKCIGAVESLGMDYEGIYRKTGGSGQSKAITSLFERGDYDAFDLCDTDSFNDISSVTSVLKNYFRSLPNPLLTYGLHEAFVAAAGIRDPQAKAQALRDLVTQLPAEHYYTLSSFMLHLHRVQLQADVNLMTARNLGVIFGPTLMRSQDASREFADMAGKSLAIEWLIENAPSIFASIPAS